MIVVSINEKREIQLVQVADDWALCSVLGRYFPKQEMDSIPSFFSGETPRYISHQAKKDNLDQGDMIFETKRLLTSKEAYSLHKEAKYLNTMKSQAISIRELKSLLSSLKDDDLISFSLSSEDGSVDFKKLQRPIKSRIGVYTLALC